jgi:hypothetical protein
MLSPMLAPFAVTVKAPAFHPVFSPTTATVAPGSTAKYINTMLAASVTNVSASCLNLPSGATCSYSASDGTLSIATATTTPAGNWQITVVFVETVPVSAAAALLLLPFVWVRYRSGHDRKHGRKRYVPAIGLFCLTVTLLTSCGGGGKGSSTTPPPATRQVTSSGSITLVVQ